MRTIAIIPARAGSKGIKNKNIHSINGKPLIQYTIDSMAKNSSCFDNIFITSDSEKILDIAKLNNITQIKRPERHQPRPLNNK